MKRTISSVTMFAMFTLLVISLVLVGCGSTGSSSSPITTLSLYASGDVNVQHLWQNTLIPQYKKAHPNIDFKLVFSEHGTNDTAALARLSAAVNTNRDPGMDIIESSNMIGQAAQARLLQPLTTQEIPQLDHIDGTLLQQNDSRALPYRASSVVLAYNSQYAKEPPRTLSDLLAWVKANPSKFTYNSPDSGGSGQAFVQLMLRSHINDAEQPKFTGANYDPTLESQWKAGLDDMKALKPYIYNKGFYPNGNNAVLQLLANGSIWVAPVWSDQSLTALSTHQLPDSVKLVQISPAFSGSPAFLGVPRTSAHIQQATAFLNWLLDDNIQAQIVNVMHGYPGVQWSHVPDNVRQQYSSIAQSYATPFSAKFNADLNKQWQSQVAGG